MTRDEFEKAVDKISLDYPFRHIVNYLKAHDAEQRAEIARLAEWQRIVLGTGTDQEAVIRMAAAEYTKVAVQCWKEKCAQQEQEIARLQNEVALLKADDAERCVLIRDMEEDERRKDAVIEETRRTAGYWKAEHLAGNATIERQAQQIARLENGLGCSRSHPHEDMNQICELRTEVARLKNELSQRTNLEGSAPCWNSAHMKQIATLREVLGKLVKEIDGILGIGEEQIRNIVGNTNVNVLHIKIAIAQQALKETTT